MKKVGKTTRPFRYDLNQIPYDYTVQVRNRFKRLDRIDRVPDELWMEVCDIVQETGNKTIPKKKKCKKAKWLSEEALQIAVKRREVKSKGEKERYKHLNAEFQRIARRDKKAFFSNQCKEIEENNRMGKTRDLFKKIRDTKEAFHPETGRIGRDDHPEVISFAGDIHPGVEKIRFDEMPEIEDQIGIFAILKRRLLRRQRSGKEQRQAQRQNTVQMTGHKVSSLFSPAKRGIYPLYYGTA